MEHVQMARGTYRVRLACPELARRITPGQFVMVRLADRDDPLLGRPFALYDTVLDAGGSPIAIDVVYLVVGRMTKRLPNVIVGSELELWGPLGNGFPARQVKHLIMVAGTRATGRPGRARDAVLRRPIQRIPRRRRGF